MGKVRSDKVASNFFAKKKGGEKEGRSPSFPFFSHKKKAEERRDKVGFFSEALYFSFAKKKAKKTMFQRLFFSEAKKKKT
jgi:hypothetical protein